MKSSGLTRAITVLFFLDHHNSSELYNYWFCAVCDSFHFLIMLDYAYKLFCL